ncbi:hypothetical protein [Nitritalea halalkaliphila]|uniref:hypothetical protein n=1 Tax=Nitritalea halalkaliphila TaxID=590849 RepID=UPI001EE67C3F|nr:hypothetical protein [Nitritalea halalkaliphila]
MLEHLVDEKTIYKTNETLIPNFLAQALAACSPSPLAETSSSYDRKQSRAV